MKTLVVFLALASLSWAKIVTFKDDGIVIQDEVNGKQVTISKPYGGLGPRNLEIIVSGPNALSKRIQVTDQNQVSVSSEDNYRTTSRSYDDVEERSKRSIPSQYGVLRQILGQYQGLPIAESTYDSILQQLQVAAQREYINPSIVTALESLSYPVNLELLEAIAPQVIQTDKNSKKWSKKQGKEGGDLIGQILSKKYSKGNDVVQQLQEQLVQQGKPHLVNPYVPQNYLVGQGVPQGNVLVNPINGYVIPQQQLVGGVLGQNQMVGLNQVPIQGQSTWGPSQLLGLLKQQKNEQILNILAQLCVNGVLVQNIQGVYCQSVNGQQLLLNAQQIQNVNNVGIQNVIKQQVCNNMGCYVGNVNQQCELLGCGLNLMDNSNLIGVGITKTVVKPVNVIDQLQQQLANVYGVQSRVPVNYEVPIGYNYLNRNIPINMEQGLINQLL